MRILKLSSVVATTALALAGLCGSTNAAILTYAFSGTYISTGGPPVSDLLAGVDYGDPFSGTVSFDSSAPSGAGQPLSISVLFDNAHQVDWTAPSATNSVIFPIPGPLPALAVFLRKAGAPEPAFLTSPDVHVSDVIIDLWSSFDPSTWPTTMAELDLESPIFTFKSLNISLHGPSINPQVTFGEEIAVHEIGIEIEEITLVPEPSSLALGGLAFGLVFAWRVCKRRTASSATLIATLAVCLACLDSAGAVTIDTVPVGNAGNAADTTGFGAVGYDYRIGTTEVTNSQYAAFLNAKATYDPFNLYSSGMGEVFYGGITRSGTSGSYVYSVAENMGSKPVPFVNPYSALRFANWLHNGQGAADTETGAYTMSLGEAVIRNPGATWFLPSNDEWYKAAYYQPASQGGDVDDYWLFATRTNSAPYSDQPPGTTSPDPSNTANFFKDDGLPNGYNDGYAATDTTTPPPAGAYLTDVGAYVLSKTFYNTFDQAGSLAEWTEGHVTFSPPWDPSPLHTWGLVGSSHSALFASDGIGGEAHLAATSFAEIFVPPDFPHSEAGFRVATIVPEPSSLVLAGLALALVIACREWKRRAARASTLFAVLTICLAVADSAYAVTIDTVPVGNPGNAADSTGYGAVSYGYRIGTTEVTVGQYTAFLNAVADTDTYSLYNPSMATDLNIAGISRSGVSGSYSYSVIGSANKPVTYVSWGDAARFSNWLHNNQPIGLQVASTTERGAYTLDGATSNAALNLITRIAGARWFIPTENEWYKSAYHQPAGQGGDGDNYWDYPTRTNSTPYSDQSPGSGAPTQSNTGNFRANDSLANGYNDGYAVTGLTTYSSSQNYLTDAGAYTMATSPYGTFDQGGNVYEWNQAFPGGSDRGLRGGMWDVDSLYLRSSSRGGGAPALEFSNIGFRVATIPEPSSLALAGLALGLVLICRARKWRAAAGLFFLAPALSLAAAGSAQALTIDTVPVRNAGNANDGAPGGPYGAVGHDYRIGTYEVTNSQYAAFLSEKAQSNLFGLYDDSMDSDARGGITRSGVNGSYSYAAKTNMGDKPVNYVNWYSAIRFTNWLHNGQGAGDTETGAYTLEGATTIPSNGETVTRNAGAIWFLPSANEWYKAAFHQPAGQGGDSDDYWDYATASNSLPTMAAANSVGVINNPGPNVTNYDFGADWNSQDGNVTTVGSAGPFSASFYGTFDQSGNVSEWLDHPGENSVRHVAGGSWSDVDQISGSVGHTFNGAPTDYVGFRVATVPEPSSLMLAGLGLVAVGALDLRRRRLRRDVATL